MLILLTRLCLDILLRNLCSVFHGISRYSDLIYFVHFPYFILVNNNSMPTDIQPIFTFKSFLSLLFQNLLTAKGWKTQIPSCQNIAPKCCRHLSKAMKVENMHLSCTYRFAGIFIHIVGKLFRIWKEFALSWEENEILMCYTFHKNE